MEINLFKHKTKIETRFADIDAFNHVNNAVYLTYLEIARVNYFDEVAEWKYDWSRKGIILAKAEINFIIPINFKDELSVYTRCSRLGTKSFDLEYRIVRMVEKKEQLMADGVTVMVAFDYDIKKSIEIPDEWKEAIRKFEEGKL
ncbi:MAG: thioesterase family protein [Bacteroidetes bacterium]|nr:thioesterase family protein [Bacteroidota bacterium]